jgi:AAA domain/Bifunctional DNA primase/polymerase, N-terminal
VTTAEAGRALNPREVNGLGVREAAHWYLAAGLRPIPWVAVEEDGHWRKRAAIAGFTYRDYTVTHDAIEAWAPAWQVGLALGRGYWALDIDSYEELAAWELEHGAGVPLEQRGWRQVSGRTAGGEHRLYACPVGAEPRHGKLEGRYQHLEVISNGLLAVSPSVHPSGRRYEWAGGELEPAPPLLAHYLNQRDQRVDRVAANQGNGHTGQSVTVDLLRGQVLGGHDNALRDLVFQQVLAGQPDEVIAVLWRAAADQVQDPAHPFTTADFQRHLRGAREKLGYPEPVDDQLMSLVHQWHLELSRGLGNPDLVEPSGDELTDEKLREALERARRARKVQRIIQREESGATFVPPALRELGAFLREPDEEVRYRVEEVWPAGGRVLLAAQYKAGKTTLRDNLVRSLVDGEPLLGEFAVQPVAGRVVVLDLELSEGMLRRWLRDQRIQREDGVVAGPLRGNARALDLLDDSVMDWWVRHLQGVGCEVLMLDCLRPALDALGLSEDKDAGRYLVKFDELLERCGAREGVIIHHMGHAAERSRGDSRLRDWPDVEWQLVRLDAEDPRSPRLFSAMGRDVDVPARNLAYDGFSRRLTASMAADIRTERELHGLDDLIDRVVEVVNTRPGLTTRDLRDELGGTPNLAGRARDEAERRGVIVVTDGPRRARLHWLPEDAPTTG